MTGPAAKPQMLVVDNEPLGVLVPEGGGLRFLAVRWQAFAADGRVFESHDQAREAVRRTVAEGERLAG